MGDTDKSVVGLRRRLNAVENRASALEEELAETRERVRMLKIEIATTESFFKAGDAVWLAGYGKRYANGPRAAVFDGFFSDRYGVGPYVRYLKKNGEPGLVSSRLYGEKLTPRKVAADDEQRSETA